MKQYQKIRMNYLLLFFIALVSCNKQESNTQVQPQYLEINLLTNVQHQTIENFGASDAWSCQFVGKNWPLAKKEAIADYLFSMELNSDGSPKGIGLSAWRFNIGAGSAEQITASGISDEWRRAECFRLADGLFDETKQQGQRWFLQAAKQRGVKSFFGFVNSPPVSLTKNEKAFSAGGSSTNLKTENYGAFSSFLCKTVTNLKNNDEIELNYISPFNEPQWDWSDGGQEGSPWLNNEIAEFCRILNQDFKDNLITTKIELPEAAQLNYLFENANKSGRANQVEEFFNPSSVNYIGNLENLAKKVAGHSYYTTWDLSHFVNVRQQVAQKVAEYPNLEFAMSEYCLLENNNEINGNGRDLGIDPALYMARVIHTDLTVANASSWQWWLAVSPYDYKDGLVYIDKNKNDGTVYDSKMLWALGNYSRFIRPGMKRIEVTRSDNRTISQTLNGVMVSSFINSNNRKTVTVIINYGNTTVPVLLKKEGQPFNCEVFRTAGGGDNLRKLGNTDFVNVVELSPRSIISFVEN